MQKLNTNQDHITSYTKLINYLARQVNLKYTIEITKDSINRCGIFDSEKYFTDDGSKSYEIFQPVYRYFHTFTGTENFFAWKSTTSWNSFAPRLSFVYNRRLGVKS